MRYHLDKSLQELKEEITKMGFMVKESLDNTLKALKSMDVKMAEEIIAHDNDIDDIESRIEKHCLNLFALQQPLAGDLRLIGSALKMITDLERIGDHSTDISELILRLSEKPVRLNPEVFNMAEKAIGMVDSSINAFVNHDVLKAEEVCAEDDVVDSLFNKLIMDIASRIRTGDESVEQLIDIMFIVKYLERIGDHATNISEWVVYNETGKHQHLQHSEVQLGVDDEKR